MFFSPKQYLRKVWCNNFSKFLIFVWIFRFPKFTLAYFCLILFTTHLPIFLLGLISKNVCSSLNDSKYYIYWQKQPSRDFLTKRYSENIQQVSQSDINHFTIKYHTFPVFSSKFAVYFQDTFCLEHLCRAASALEMQRRTGNPIKQL